MNPSFFINPISMSDLVLGMLIIATIVAFFWALHKSHLLKKMKTCEHEYTLYRVCDKCGSMQMQDKKKQIII